MSMTISGNVSGNQQSNPTADPNHQIEKLNQQVSQDSSKLMGIATSAASAGSKGVPDGGSPAASLTNDAANRPS